jgi:hypothetical protein
MAKIANLGSGKAFVSSDFWEICLIFKKIKLMLGRFIGLCYIRRRITEGNRFNKCCQTEFWVKNEFIGYAFS